MANYSHPIVGISRLSRSIRQNSKRLLITLILSPRSQVNHQRWLLPQVVDLLVQPAFALGRQRQIEVEDEAGHDGPHLCIRQVAAYAISRAKREGLHCLFLVVCKLRVAVVEPPLREVLEGLGEVVLGVEGGPLPDRDVGL